MSAANLEFSTKYFGYSEQGKFWSCEMWCIRECTVVHCCRYQFGFAFLWEAPL